MGLTESDRRGRIREGSVQVGIYDQSTMYTCRNVKKKPTNLQLMLINNYDLKKNQAVVL